MKKILILSSNNTINEELYNELKKYGHNPRCWKSLEGLTEKVEKEKPNLIIANFHLLGYRDEHIPIEDGGIIAIEKLVKSGLTIPFVFFYDDTLADKAIVYYYRIQKINSGLFQSQINIVHYPVDYKSIIEKANKI
jgi:hypothetical protein